ncbi:MAG: L,D-transpeptidase [Thermoleophilia bacterium]
MRSFSIRSVHSTRLVRVALGLAAVLVGVALAAPAARAAAPVLTLTAAPDVVLAGTPTTVTAHIDVPGASLILSRQRAGEADFTVLRTIVAGADGSVAWRPEPSRSLIYRVEFAGDSVWDATAAEAAIAVRPRLFLAAPKAVYQGRTAVFTARVAPAHPGAAVELQRRQDGVWTPWQTLTLDAESRAVYRWPTVVKGQFAFRLVMAADAGHTDGVSLRRVVAVQEPNPYNVPASAARFIVVDKSQYKLYYFEYGRIVRVFACVLGKPSTPTPLGKFKIYAKDTFPAVSSYGPRRLRYMGLFAIHGTDEPWLLQRFPRNYSHGCTRLANSNILWLFDRCRVGTRVWNVP